MSFLSTAKAGGEVRLSAALLLYEGERGMVFATAHPVTKAARSDRPVIGAGRPVDRRGLINALSELAENAAPKAEFLPAEVLGLSPHAVTWWCAPAMRRVFFNCEGVGGARSAVVPHPGLVFQASTEGFRVFAVAERGRPVPGSKLYEPPYFNTWDAGMICIGTARVPKRIDVASIAQWEAGFFESAFTHPNAGGKRVTWKGGEYAFWRKMLDGGFGEQYPLKVLVPTKLTAGELVSRRNGGVA